MSDQDIILGMALREYAHYLQEERFHGQQSHIASDVCDMLASAILGALPSNQRGILEEVPVIVLQQRTPMPMS
jgi:hypothetical protein